MRKAESKLATVVRKTTPEVLSKIEVNPLKKPQNLQLQRKKAVMVNSVKKKTPEL